MQDEYIDVNSELYFNEKLNVWLNGLTGNDIQNVLKHCFSISTDGIKEIQNVYPMDSRDPSYHRAIRFDQKIDFGKELCIIFELKVGTEATPGQLRNYLEYIPETGYKNGYVILLSRNKLAYTKTGYDVLIEEYPNLKFNTWDEFEEKLKELGNSRRLQSPKKHTESLLSLLEFLTDIEKRSQRLIIKPPPPELNISGYINKLVPARSPQRKGSFLVWDNRETFWDELIAQITKHTGYQSICAFRFDLYEYLIRLAFHKKNVYLDIYEDKNYEYYYNYFIKNIYPHKEDLPSAQLADLYYRFLLIRESEVLRVAEHSIFFRRVGKDWYVYIIHNGDQDSEIPYVHFNQYKFDNND